MPKLIALRVAVFLLALAIGDALLWLVAPVPLADRRTAFRQSLPGLRSEVVYTTFAGGFRSLTLQSLAKPAGSLRVLCIGASTTDQATQQVEDTWCAQLEQQLKARRPEWRQAFHTLSHGRGGRRTLDTLAWLAPQLDAIRPDIVVTLNGINDLAWAGGAGYAVRDIDGALAEEARRQRRSVGGGLRYCLAISQICRRVNAAWAGLGVGRGLGTASRIEWHSANLDRLRADYRALPAVDGVVRDPDPIAEHQAASARLVDLLAERNVALIVLGQPVLWRTGITPAEVERLWFPVNTPGGFVRPPGRWLHAEMQRYNAVQRQEAARRGAAYVDLDALVAKDLAHYFDDCHFTDKGSAAVAEAVLPHLERAITARLSARKP